MWKSGIRVPQGIVLTDIMVCNIPLTNIQTEKKPLSAQNNDFRRDLSPSTSQIWLKLALMANAPHLLCTCGSQIMQSDCMIILSAHSERRHSL